MLYILPEIEDVLIEFALQLGAETEEEERLATQYGFHFSGAEIRADIEKALVQWVAEIYGVLA